LHVLAVIHRLRRLLDDVPKRLAAFALATIAWDAARLDRVGIVPGQLFARTDPSPAIEKRATLPALVRQIRTATVVNELGAAAAYVPINRATLIEDDSIIGAVRLELGCLVYSHASAGKFDHLMPYGNIIEREYAEPVNPRSADSQAIAYGFRTDPAARRGYLPHVLVLKILVCFTLSSS
jgi:hypothetical protein